jgi:hypothetical protein
MFASIHCTGTVAWCTSSLTIDKDYVVQQQRRRYVRLGSIVKAARAFQKTVITNDNRRITVGKLQEMAQVCASALRHGNIGKARELLEDVSHVEIGPESVDGCELVYSVCRAALPTLW